MTVLIAPQPFKNYTCRNGQYASDGFGRLTVTDATDQGELITLGCVVESADDRADPFKQYDLTASIRTDYLGRYTATGTDATAMSARITSPSSFTLVMPRRFKAYQAPSGVYRSDRFGRVTVSNAADQTSLVAQGGVAVSGGTPVTVILLWTGQSNSVGATGSVSYDPALDTNDPNILEWPYPTGTAAIPALDGFNQWPVNPGLPHGPTPMMSAARTYLAMLPAGSQIICIAAGAGSTGLVSDGGYWSAPSGTGYVSAKSRLTEALTAYPGARVICGWQQGENDANAAIGGSTYNTAFAAMIAGWRSVSGAANMAVVIGSMVYEWVVASQGAREIEMAHKKAATAYDNVFFIHGPRGYPYVPDNNIHYDPTGLRTIGPYMARAFDAASALTSAAPGVPGSVTLGAGTVSFTVPSTNAVYYSVESRPVGATGAWLASTVYPNIYAVPGDTLTFGIPGGGVRDVRVKAVSRAGSSSYAATQTYTPAAFNPLTDVANVVAWFNPRDNTTVFKDAGTTQAVAGTDTVQQANSTLGTSLKASQATAGNRPPYITDSLAGQKAYNWVAASSTRLICTDAAVLNAATGTDNDYTLIFAVRRGPIGVSTTIASWARVDGSGLTNTVRFSMGSGNGFGSLRQDGTNYTVSEAGLSPSGGADAWYIVTYAYSGTEMVIRVNGVEVARGTQDSNAIVFTQFVLGAFVNQGTTSFYGDGASGDVFLIDTGTVSSSVIAAEDYLANLYVMPAYA